MKLLIKTLILSLAVGLLFSLASCDQTEKNDAEDFQDEVVSQEDLGFAPEVSDHVDGLNFSLEDAQPFDFVFPDGTSEERYLVEEDLALTRKQLEEMKKESENGSRQYRTYDLVASPRTINVIGYTGANSSGLSANMKVALQYAIWNYNSLNIGLNFNLTFGTNYGPSDIVVYRINNGERGGVAGFPSNGNPYKWVQIFSGLDNDVYNTIEHVMTHEIGHSVGLRHTDYFNRASCGQNSNEGSAGVGAVHIPGTPTGIDWNSVMLACFGNNEDGEFGYYDRVALEYLY